MSDSGDSSEEEESQTFVADVVHFGKSYKYKIPSFPVVTLDLRHAVIHGVDEESGEHRLSDAFFRDDPSLD